MQVPSTSLAELPPGFAPSLSQSQQQPAAVPTPTKESAKQPVRQTGLQMAKPQQKAADRDELPPGFPPKTSRQEQAAESSAMPPGFPAKPQPAAVGVTSSGLQSQADQASPQPDASGSRVLGLQSGHHPVQGSLAFAGSGTP